MKFAKGAVAVLTGATTGIGYAIAERLAREGYHVVVSSRRKSNVDRAVARLRNQGFAASGVACHVGQDEDRNLLLSHAKAVREDGMVHALVLNAAASTAFGDMLKTSESQMEKMFQVNVMAVFMTVQLFSRSLEEGASIVLTSSVGAYTPIRGLGVYSVTKTALLGMTKAMALELADRKIRVNCVAPGIIKTRFSERLWKDEERRSGSKENQSALQAIPLKRYGLPSDVSGAVAFLVSEDSSYITGEAIVVAGGLQSRL